MAKNQYNRRPMDGKTLRIVTHNLGVKNRGMEYIASEILRRQGRGGPFYKLSKLEARGVIFAYASGLSAEAHAPIPKVKAAKGSVSRRPKRAVEPKVGFYWSDEWRSLRYQALRKSRGVCELCGGGPQAGKPLHVDHIKPRSKYPALELDLSNLQVLCADCNLGKSNTDEIDWRRSA